MGLNESYWPDEEEGEMPSFGRPLLLNVIRQYIAFNRIE